MIENGTFHVITTELVVGSFALAGLCFVLHAFFTWRLAESPQYSNIADTTAHAALFFGLLALPFAIISGLGASPTGAHTSPLSQIRCCYRLPVVDLPSVFSSHVGKCTIR